MLYFNDIAKLLDGTDYGDVTNKSNNSIRKCYFFLNKF